MRLVELPVNVTPGSNSASTAPQGHRTSYAAPSRMQTTIAPLYKEGELSSISDLGAPRMGITHEGEKFYTVPCIQATEGLTILSGSMPKVNIYPVSKMATLSKLGSQYGMNTAAVIDYSRVIAGTGPFTDTFDLLPITQVGAVMFGLKLTVMASALRPHDTLNVVVAVTYADNITVQNTTWQMEMSSGRVESNLMLFYDTQTFKPDGTPVLQMDPFHDATYLMSSELSGILNPAAARLDELSRVGETARLIRSIRVTVTRNNPDVVTAIRGMANGSSEFLMFMKELSERAVVSQEFLGRGSQSQNVYSEGRNPSDYNTASLIGKAERLLNNMD